MASLTSDHHGLGLEFPRTLQAHKFSNFAAATISLALICAVGVWGYKLFMRDVSEIPAVLASEMRVLSENPGGEIAAHIGVLDKSVPALGNAAEPEGPLVLASKNMSLQDTDLELAPSADAGEVVGSDQNPALSTLNLPSEPLTISDVLAIADQMAADATPMSDLADGVNVPIEVAVNGATVSHDLIPDGTPGVRLSVRPIARPKSQSVVVDLASPTVRPIPRPTSASNAVVAALISADVAPAAITTTGNVTKSSVTTAAPPAGTKIPAGTEMVQIGSFQDAEIAARQWVRMTQRFPDLFEGKYMLIQKTKSGAFTFFRLRAMGFTDSSDALRFCSALFAEGAACIPVVI